MAFEIPRNAILDRSLLDLIEEAEQAPALDPLSRTLRTKTVSIKSWRDGVGPVRVILKEGDFGRAPALRDAWVTLGAQERKLLDWIEGKVSERTKDPALAEVVREEILAGEARTARSYLNKRILRTAEDICRWGVAGWPEGELTQNKEPYPFTAHPEGGASAEALNALESVVFLVHVAAKVMVFWQECLTLAPQEGDAAAPLPRTKKGKKTPARAPRRKTSRSGRA